MWPTGILYITRAAVRDTVAEAHRAHTNSALFTSWGPFSRRSILIYQFGFPTDQPFFYSARVAVSTFQSLCYLLVLLLSLCSFHRFVSSIRSFPSPACHYCFFLFLHVLCFASTAKQDIYIFLFFSSSTTIYFYQHLRSSFLSCFDFEMSTSAYVYWITMMSKPYHASLFASWTI